MKFTGGLPETQCGAGSTLVATETLRTILPYLFQTFSIRSLLDAPCGDGNWISQTDLTGIEYCGIDNFADNLEIARRREHHSGFEPATRTYLQQDLAGERLPLADAILCRDFFQHLQTAVALQIVENVRKAGIRLLMATSFRNDSNQEIGPEMFRPLNLQAAPFHLGKPVFAFPDPPGTGRILGLWRI